MSKKVRAVVNDVGTERDTWVEFWDMHEYDDGTTETGEACVKRVMDNFHNTLRPGESPREVLGFIVMEG